jgi:hypothetical protein
MYKRQEPQGEYKKGGRDQSALAILWDTSKRKGKIRKELAGGAGYYWEGIMNTRQGSSQLITRARTKQSTPEQHTSNNGGTSSCGKRTSLVHKHYFGATSSSRLSHGGSRETKSYYSWITTNTLPMGCCEKSSGIGMGLT